MGFSVFLLAASSKGARDKYQEQTGSESGTGRHFANSSVDGYLPTWSLVLVPISGSPK